MAEVEMIPRLYMLFLSSIQSLTSTHFLVALLNTAVVGYLMALLKIKGKTSVQKKQEASHASFTKTAGGDEDESEDDKSVEPLLACIRDRRSVFPRSYAKGCRVSVDDLNRVLEAAMWAPFHGPIPPWRFVVLGPKAMREMQQVTLKFYDENWKRVGKYATEEQYLKWRQQTEEEIEGRWGPVSYMVGIVCRRQASLSKRLPMWEEEAATACAVQNMHLQASSMRVRVQTRTKNNTDTDTDIDRSNCRPSEPEPAGTYNSTSRHRLACYWSSWHAAARDSEEMRRFLNMESEDRCLGFFMVAAFDPNKVSDKRRRKPETHLCVSWRG